LFWQVNKALEVYYKKTKPEVAFTLSGWILRRIYVKVLAVTQLKKIQIIELSSVTQ